ncbi:pilin isopeptide linkage protein/LPXTG-motif cell wall-anchored protein [Enterococcus sp. PF1-24]|uniref:Spy0128 family protein n=1 Tax=unclassified Enterococcus TaxID=2608891 RepID=UPI0024735D66|nr:MULTISPECIES: FctA domain-containing protein [unclassified Enterococcus]MDH6365125.1 pilin isopeptide linkage protein/LPXTG-motif cell wall-anchored protein [Enterococcus sp. PFB1-1]MDH6402226.1 pilin isopeptide linkage protein/LPXTG-motif cell wall-anchored protein [Enterococcus sp. PF1-24]
MKQKISVLFSLAILFMSTFASPIAAIAETMTEVETSEYQLADNTNQDALLANENNQGISNGETSTVENANNLIENEETADFSTDEVINATSTEENSEEQARAPSEEAVTLNAGTSLNDRGVNLFDNITIADNEGNPFTEENLAHYNDNINITIDWSLANDVDISDGDYYTYQMPPYFAVHNAIEPKPIYRTNGGSSDVIGYFEMDANGLLKVVFNENATNLSDLSGKIELTTELNIVSETEEQEIKTGITDSNGNEIIIVVPVYNIDLKKTGEISKHSNVLWDIVFNENSETLTNVVLTEVMPEGLTFTKGTSYGSIYNEATGTWDKVTDLYEFDPVTNTFTFNQAITTPVKISINSTVIDSSIKSFTNTAKISGDQFFDKSVSATVSFDDLENYKRFTGYDNTTGEASWELSASLKNVGASILDNTYSGTDSSAALHYLVRDSIVVTKKNGDPVAPSAWTLLTEDAIEKDGELVQFKLVFQEPGDYIITYQTKLFDPIFSDTTIYNHMNIKDGTFNTGYDGVGTAKPESNMGIEKKGVSVDYENHLMNWSVKVNSNHETMNNAVFTDLYRLSNGSNMSALELFGDMEIKTSTGVTLTKGTDYAIELLHEQTATGITYESGFKIELLGSYATIDEEFTINYVTKYNIRNHEELFNGGNQFSNSIVVSYQDINGNPRQIGDDDSLRINKILSQNASKGGFFVPKDGSVVAGLRKYLAANTYNVFGETIAPSDSVYWVATFNRYKETLPANSTILEKLGDGQAIRSLKIFGTTINGQSGGVANFTSELVLGVNYAYEVAATGEVIITLLKSTDLTLSIAIAADAAVDTYEYKNYAELRDPDNNTIVVAEGEIEKSAKDKWLVKNGVQNSVNNRLADWKVIVNQDSRTVSDAVVTDTVKLSQQSFVLDDQNNMIVHVYKAIANGDEFDKGEEITFSEGFGPSLEMNPFEGTQTMSIKFEGEINSPYIIEYQTKLDPGIVNNEKVANDVKLSGNQVEIHQVTKEITIKSTDGSGTSSGVNGALSIEKLDANTNEGIDDSAFFDIFRQNANGDYELFISNVEVKNNKIIDNEGNPIDQISNLRYGKYAIKEVAAPNGYILDETLHEFEIPLANSVVTLLNERAVVPATELVLAASKELVGKNLTAGEFTFELMDSVGNVLQTKTNDSSGKIYFDEINYDTVGTYEYSIREVVGMDNTISYDDTIYKVTVTVTDENGQLVATPSYEGDAIFKNSYTPQSGGTVLEASKELVGKNLTAGEFNFELVDSVGNVLQTKTNDINGKVYFDAISYDVAGIYEYTIREVVGTDSTISYDDTVYKVTVTVVDENGQLVATPSYEGDAIFKNNYAPKTGGTVLEASKELTGKNLSAGEFTFELADSEGNVLQTKSNDANGKIYFDEITYDAAGTYEYTIREVTGTDSTISYDNNVYSVKLTVVDENGQLVATPSYEGDVIFKNSYAPKAGSTVLEANKELTGKNLSAGEFSFELVDGEGNVLQTKTNDANGKIYFDAINYDVAGSYQYTIREVAGTDSTISYDGTVYNVVVTVVDENGQLVATASYEGDVIFKNSYAPKGGSTVLEATKELTGKNLSAGEFSFELVDSEGNVLQTKTNDANGKIYFDEIIYDAAGKYEYTIREVAGKNNTITYDNSVYKVTVTVVDENGQLVATPSYEGSVIFKNSYAAKGGNIVLEAEKELTGKNLSAGEFNFELVDKDGNVLQTKTNNGSGKIYFDAIAYQQVGTYEYTIREVKGTNSTINYDGTVYKVTVTVTDENGQLVAKANYEGDVVFKNSYTPKDDHIILEAEKELAGKKLTAGEFKFELVDSAGNVLQTKTNNANGKIYFDALTYDTVGTYEYTIREVVGTDSTISYDSTVYKVTVTVMDENGQLVATTVYEKTAIFKNVYTNPSVKLGEVTLKKVDSKTGEVLAGAEFELRNAKGEVIRTGIVTDKNGLVTLKDLAVGEYQLVEVKAPKGYLLDSTPIRFSITADQVSEMQLTKENQPVGKDTPTKPTTPSNPKQDTPKKNTPGKLPNTGETTSNVSLIVGVLCIVLGLGLFYNKRKVR